MREVELIATDLADLTKDELIAKVMVLEERLDRLVTVCSQQQHCPDGISCDGYDDCEECWMKIAMGGNQ